MKESFPMTNQFFSVYLELEKNSFKKGKSFELH